MLFENDVNIIMKHNNIINVFKYFKKLINSLNFICVT